MWYWCHIHFRILCNQLVTIIDCRKLKIEVGVAYSCIPFILILYKSVIWSKNLEKESMCGEHDLLNLLVAY